MRVEATTGERAPLVDLGRLEAAIAALPGVAAGEAGRVVARRAGHVFNPRLLRPRLRAGGRPVSLRHRGRSHRPADGVACPPRPRCPSAPTGASSRSCARATSWSPTRAGFREHELTDDGGGRIRNGQLDWVYQEEIYGRGNFRAYWWSPDSTRIAYLQLDDRDVPSFTVLDHIPYRPEVETWDYPKAGDANPVVRLGVVGAEDAGRSDVVGWTSPPRTRPRSRSSSTSAGPPTAAGWCSRSRTGSRPGSTSTWPTRGPATRIPCFARRARRGSTSPAHRPGCATGRC